ncbi:glycosyltransferase family 4 protein [Halomonas salipaludis]|uniref:Group 1 glycosyl transferase n=1 Tax=Halomonas salipaludis TaxID=2032625 RepID=A0A2A2F4B9_9GAMM|nr:glycosyltransferase family 4 protein [Halomonas salipaludis]PAU79452.1 group 1 glycosyl transferase [Halomonas salipaludis]
MKILYVSSSTVPSRTANSVHVMKMSQAFANNGHDVTLIASEMHATAQPGVEDVFSHYGVEKNFSLLNLAVPKLPGQGYLFGALSAWHAWRGGYDVVFCRNFAACYFSALLGKPVIFETHMPMGERKLLGRIFFKRLLKSPRLKQVVVITHALKRRMEQDYPQIKGRVVVAPDGADPVADDVVPMSLDAAEGRIQVGYVGHLYKGKGMEIVSQLAARCPWADFHVVGGMEEDLDHWKRECAGTDNIVFHGYVSHQQAKAYIKAFDVVLLPNQRKVAAYDVGEISQWTSPLKAFEYMAAGKPIIASDLPVLREVLIEGENALLCDCEDVEAWGGALARLRDEPTLAKQLAERAKAIFLEKYTWQARAAALAATLATRS